MQPADDLRAFFDAYARAGNAFDVEARSGMIVTFLALLEMIRLKLVRVYQQGNFGPIRVYRRAKPEGAPFRESGN